MSSSLQPLTFAFGGGGVKSVACAGVLAVVEEAGLPVGPLVGASGGGVVAILYGVGYSPLQIRDIFDEINLAEVWEGDSERKAIFGASRIRARFATLVGEKTFADLKRPAVAMAMDLHTEQPVRLDSGSLVDAMTATMAIPGLFRGVERGEQLLVDGGPVSPLPVGPARQLGQRVVAIDVLAHRSPDEFNHVLESRGPMRYAGVLARQFGLNTIVNHAYQTASAMTRRLSEYSLQLHPPDLLLRPEVGRVGLFAFDLADVAFDVGLACARAALPQLTALAQPASPGRMRAMWQRFRQWRIKRKG